MTPRGAYARTAPHPPSRCGDALIHLGIEMTTPTYIKYTPANTAFTTGEETVQVIVQGPHGNIVCEINLDITANSAAALIVGRCEANTVGFSVALNHSRILPTDATLREAGVRDGDTITPWGGGLLGGSGRAPGRARRGKDEVDSDSDDDMTSNRETTMVIDEAHRLQVAIMAIDEAHSLARPNPSGSSSSSSSNSSNSTDINGCGGSSDGSSSSNRCGSSSSSSSGSSSSSSDSSSNSSDSSTSTCNNSSSSSGSGSSSSSSSSNRCSSSSSSSSDNGIGSISRLHKRKIGDSSRGGNSSTSTSNELDLEIELELELEIALEHELELGPEIGIQPEIELGQSNDNTMYTTTVTTTADAAHPAKRRRSTRIAALAPQPRNNQAQEAHPNPDTLPAAPIGADQAMDTAIEAAARLEATWGIGGMQNSWDEGDEMPDLLEEVARLWPQTQATSTSIVISPAYKVMRILYVQAKGTELRYITPYSAWYHTMSHGGGPITYMEPEPAPLTDMPAFAAAIGFAALACDSAEHRLRMQLMLSDNALLHQRHPFRIIAAKQYPFKKTASIAKYWCSVSADAAPSCPGCRRKNTDDGGCKSERTLTVDMFYNTCTVQCAGTKRPTRTRAGTDTVAFLFGTKTPRLPRQPTRWCRPPAVVTQDQPQARFRAHNGEQKDDLDTRSGAQPEEHIAEEPQTNSHTTRVLHDLTIVSYNTDNSARTKLAELLSFFAEVHADVVLLQDIEDQRWSNAYILSQGWVLYTHKRVGILLRVSTAERVISCTDKTGTPRTRVWRSQDYNSMGVVLDTTKGSLFIACAYLPPGVDDFANDPPTKREER